MKPEEITSRVYSIINDHSYKAAIVSSLHAAELRETIAEKIQTNSINESVQRQYPEDIEGMLKPGPVWAQTIIVVAAPEPVLEVNFSAGGRKHSAIIPPTYEHTVDIVITELIEGELSSHGYRIARATLPLKLLAVRSGLARYGKNNIAYVDEFGSFHRLVAFYTDLPTVKDTWMAPRVLEECSGCKACTAKCPTGAICSERFQVRAERCLTFFNESSDPFPEWVHESWHHCLVGCMKCQQYCPVNKDVRLWKEGFAEINDEESALLLGGANKDSLPEHLVSRFENTNLLGDPYGLSRNLKSILRLSDRSVKEP
jgi:epoxyqueuosine reductase